MRTRTQVADVVRLGTSLLGSDDIPELLAKLHTHMAGLRDQLEMSGSWEWFVNVSVVTESMVAKACDPACRTLLDWSVYTAIMDAAKVQAEEAQGVRRLYRTIEVLQTADPKPANRTSGPLSHLRWELAAITTEAGLMDHLSDLMKQKGWALRKTAQELERLSPKVGVSRSTLSNWFNQRRLPANREAFEVLVSALLPDYLLAAGRAPVNLYMGRYDALRAALVSVDDAADGTVDDDAAIDWKARYEQSERARQELAKLLTQAQDVITEQTRKIELLQKEPVGRYRLVRESIA
jgi:hypothetical protein